MNFTFPRFLIEKQLGKELKTFAWSENLNIHVMDTVSSNLDNGIYRGENLKGCISFLSFDDKNMVLCRHEVYSKDDLFYDECFVIGKEVLKEIDNNPFIISRSLKRFRMPDSQGPGLPDININIKHPRNYRNDLKKLNLIFDISELALTRIFQAIHGQSHLIISSETNIFETIIEGILIACPLESRLTIFFSTAPHIRLPHQIRLTWSSPAYENNAIPKDYLLSDLKTQAPASLISTDPEMQLLAETVRNRRKHMSLLRSYYGKYQLDMSKLHEHLKAVLEDKPSTIELLKNLLALKGRQIVFIVFLVFMLIFSARYFFGSRSIEKGGEKTDVSAAISDRADSAVSDLHHRPIIDKEKPIIEFGKKGTHYYKTDFTQKIIIKDDVSVNIKESKLEINSHQFTLKERKHVSNDKERYELGELIEREANGITLLEKSVIFSGEGTYQLMVEAIDDSEKSTTASKKIVIDKTRPQVKIAGVKNGHYLNVDVTPDIDFIDDDITRRFVYLNSSSYMIGQPIINEDYYELEVKTFDMAGNGSGSEIIFFTIDKTPPVISVANISEGQLFTTGVIPQISIREPNRNRGAESILLNGVNYIPGTPVIKDGDYQLTINAEDLAKNPSIEHRISFVIDQNGPDIRFGIVDGKIYNTSVIPDIRIEDGHSGINSTELKLNDAPYVRGERISEDGQYVLKINSVDKASNKSHRSIKFYIDTKEPYIEINGIDDKKAYNVPLKPTIKVYDANLESTKILLNEERYHEGTDITKDGDYRFVVVARDIANRQTKTEVRFIIDQTLPVILIEGVEDSQYTKNALTPVIHIEEPNIVKERITLNGKDFKSGSKITEEKEHVLEVFTLDEAQNSSSKKIRFVIDRTPPKINISNLSNDQKIYKGNFNPAITFKDNVDDEDSLEPGIIKVDNEVYSPGRSLATGRHELYVSVSDRAGNTAEKTINFEIRDDIKYDEKHQRDVAKLKDYCRPFRTAHELFVNKNHNKKISEIITDNKLDVTYETKDFDALLYFIILMDKNQRKQMLKWANSKIRKLNSKERSTLSEVVGYIEREKILVGMSQEPPTIMKIRNHVKSFHKDEFKTISGGRQKEPPTIMKIKSKVERFHKNECEITAAYRHIKELETTLSQLKFSD